jgi:photosystem II stability/assembly factor-like uncharacterized protein
MAGVVETGARGGIEIVEKAQRQALGKARCGVFSKVALAITYLAKKSADKELLVEVILGHRQQCSAPLEVDRWRQSSNRVQIINGVVGRFSRQLQHNVAAQRKSDKRHRGSRAPGCYMLEDGTHIAGAGAMIGSLGEADSATCPAEIHAYDPHAAMEQRPADALHISGSMASSQTVNQHRNSTTGLPRSRGSVVDDDPVAVVQFNLTLLGGKTETPERRKITQERLDMRIAQERQRTELGHDGDPLPCFAIVFLPKKPITKALFHGESIMLNMLNRLGLLALAFFSLLESAPITQAQPPYRAELFDCMHWRMIGPFRGGRTVGATGVRGQPNVFYIGVNNGGVWKTDDFGRVWNPIVDEQPTGSIGALAVAPSDPKTIYVGSGEGLQRPDLSTGDGVYKSTDGGKTWKHLGLRDGLQISAIIVDPTNPDRVFVAVLGHPYGANAERGVFRSTDGGNNWEKVLYKDENTGAIALAFDPTNPQVIYANLWAARQGPWENGEWQGPNSGLFKSTDGGTTWRQLTKGLPTTAQGLGRIGFAIAPSDSRRMYAVVDAPELGGIYRSDDAGESWRRVNSELRLWGRGSDFAEVQVDPKNPERIYVANTSTYRSDEAGVTFTAIKGAPGGDDYHTIWINPDNPQIILLASDQGAVVTVNGGQSWSSWYNQPTAQFYHVITDNQFPYWVYGGQQESGSAGVASRGNDGQITFRDWRPIGVEEYGYVAPDPLHPNLLYGGKISCTDMKTGQVQDVSPEAVRAGKYRFLRTAPVIFSPVDQRVLYFAGNVLFKTTTGGKSWNIISPDLSREKPEVPESIGIYRTPQMVTQPRRGVIYTVAPSYKDVNTIWAGTDDGLIHVTRDAGKTWNNITPPELTPWSKVSLIDAGRFDANTAYAAINRIRLDDQRPHILRTHDGGKSWQKITRGLPDNAPVNSVREDPVRPGLLFAGTERAVFVSFNDGDDWQALRLNMPATSIRDLVIHGDDLVVGTHGRSFWILDNITPLRQIDGTVSSAQAHLYQPQAAHRVRWNLNTDTPLPPEEPAGKNPPDGAVIDCYLKESVAGPVTMEIVDSQGKIVRRFASTDQPEPVNEKELAIPTYWLRPPQILSAGAGSHRFVWDLHYPAPPGAARDYPIAAVYKDTVSEPLGPWVMPGEYRVRLSVDGKTMERPLVVKMDPRVATPLAELQQQYDLSMQAYLGMIESQKTLGQVRKLLTQVRELKKNVASKALSKPLDDLEAKLAALEGGSRPGRRFGRRVGGAATASLTSMNGTLGGLLQLLQGTDAAPTTQAVEACKKTQESLAEVMARWREVSTKDVAALNGQLRGAKLPVVAFED